MKPAIYRAATFCGLALDSIFGTQREAISDWLDLRSYYGMATFVVSGRAFTLSLLFTTAAAYLWASARNSN